MADEKISLLDELVTPAAGDLFAIVDVSEPDETNGQRGSSKGM